MAGLTLLVSYPKSGNTWVRIFLDALRHGGVPNINALDIPNAAERETHDRLLDLESSDLSPREMARARPFVSERRAQAILKVHDANLPPPGADRAPFGADTIARVVYIVRDPRDVAVSCAHHFGISITQAVADLGDEKFMMGLSKTGPNANLEQFVSSWSRHAQSWLDDAKRDVLLVRYEDLLDDPLKHLSAIADFTGLPSHPDAVQPAIDASSFSALSGQERAQGFREVHDESSSAFFRSGMAGGWRATLPPALATRIVNEHGAMMRRLGYATD